MSNPGTSEWTCQCKDCGTEFRYSNTNYEANKMRGFSRPERCLECRRQHAKEINTVGQPYFKVKPLFPGVQHEHLVSVLGRLNHPPRPHRAEHVIPKGEPPDKFGIKDDKIVEMFRWFAQDPGLQVVVVVGPTGSGKSTYFPYRLVHPPKWYTTTEPDPDATHADPGKRRVVRDADGSPTRFDASDIPADLFHRYGQIVVTQPRIQATRNIPGYIAKAMLGSSLGAGFDIGYQYAKNPASDWRSKLRFCTDGSMINWIATGQLDKINTVMIDEAHERSLNIDIIIGLLTQALPRYPRLKLIIASATISADLFINHFNKHLPAGAVHELATGESAIPDLLIGEETKERRKLSGVTRTVGRPESTVQPDGSRGSDVVRTWLLKPAEKCELMEFDGKAFRVDPHFHDEAIDGEQLPYEFLDPTSNDSRTSEAVEGKLRKLAKTSHKHVADNAIGLLGDMYLTREQLIKGVGIRRTKSLEPNGEVPQQEAKNPKWRRTVDVTERRGDILCFLHGEQPIRDCCKLVSAAAPKLKCAVKPLPLYTQLPQTQQDEALLERKPSVHDDLATRILRLIDAGYTDLLAHSDNVGAVLGLEYETVEKLLADEMARRWGIPPERLIEVRKRLLVQRWSGEEAVVVADNPKDKCTRNENAELKPKPEGGVRVVVGSSRAFAVWGVDYERATDGVEVELDKTKFRFIKQKEEVRRVVVSTNVAETSLTIHGILHVVDSGFINQKKWMPETQTEGIRAIVQSRAGCKQRWGRAGRLQAGDAWPLYTREQFGCDSQVKEAPGAPGDPRCFPYYSQPEIRRSPLEQILLTAKKAGLESLDVHNFPWLEAPDPDELKRAETSLKAKGALDESGRLTEHGLELTAFQSEAKLANLMVIADRMACAVEMATVLAALKVGPKKLFLKNNDWDDATTKRVQVIQASLVASCQDDLEVLLKVVAAWELARAAGQALTDLWRWNARWQIMLDGFGFDAGSGARLLAAELGTALSEQRVKELRPPKGSDLSPLFEALRVEAARGVNRRQSWITLSAHWDLLTKLPDWTTEWRAAATEDIRIECVAQEVLSLALQVKDPSALLDSLAKLETKEVSPEQRATPQSDGGEPMRQEAADADASRVESATRFWTAVAKVLKRYSEGMPPRGTKRQNSGSSPGQPDEAVEADWRSLNTLAVGFVTSLGARFREPAVGSEGSEFVAIAESASTLEQFGRLGGRQEWIERVQNAVPEAAAKAWCAANYVDAHALSDKGKIDAGRNELVDSLSGHKKEDERRPLNLALLDRIRLIFAHALPDHCYEAAVDGYKPIVADNKPLPAVIEQDSVCASNPPSQFVCATRRALPLNPMGERTLGAGFIVRLDEEVKITPDVIRGSIGRRPLFAWSVFELAAHLPESDVAQAIEETNLSQARLLYEQRFPLHSQWMFTLHEQVSTLPDEEWLVTGTLVAARKGVAPRHRHNEELSETPDDDLGGDFEQSTDADERAYPTYAYEAGDVEPGGRSILVHESQTIETPLGCQIRDQDVDREALAAEEQDVDDRNPIDVPARAVPSENPALKPVRIRFVMPAAAVPKPGDTVRGWILGTADIAGTVTAMVGRQDPEVVLAALDPDQPYDVEVIGPAIGPKPGLRVRIVGTEAEATMMPRDFGFRDDSSVTKIMLDAHREAASAKKALRFEVSLWEVVPAERLLRVTTRPRVIAWWKSQEQSLPVSGKLLRSNPTNPDYVSVLVHPAPNEGLVIVAEANSAQFNGVTHDVPVAIRLSRHRDRRRLPSVKRTCTLPVGATRLGLTVTDKGNTKYGEHDAMTLDKRAKLLSLARDDYAFRGIVDELFEQSNAWFADNAKAADTADTLLNSDQDIYARVVEVNADGANLEVADPRLRDAAGLKLRLGDREYGGLRPSWLVRGADIVVRATGNPGSGGQVNVTIKPGPGWLLSGKPVEAVARGIRSTSPGGADGEVAQGEDDSEEASTTEDITPDQPATLKAAAGLRLVDVQGIELFCRPRDFFPNVELDFASLDAMVISGTSLPLVVRAGGNGKDPSCSHLSASLYALRCRYPQIVGDTFRGRVTIEEALRRDGRLPDVFALVSFGPRLRARCSFGNLGLGHVWASHKRDLEALLGAGRPVLLDFQLRQISDDRLELTAEPIWGRWVDGQLRGRVLSGTVVGVKHPHVNIRIAPFVVGGCFVRQWGKGEFIKDVAVMASVGDSVTVMVTGFDDADNLQLDRGAAIGKSPSVLPAGPPPARTDLAALIEDAHHQLVTALVPLEEAITARDWAVAEERVSAFRALFPNAPETACPFARRVRFFKDLHDTFLSAGNAGDHAMAGRCWPKSTRVAPAPPSAVRASCVGEQVELKWAKSSEHMGLTYRIARGGAIVKDGLTECGFTDVSPPRGVLVEYTVTAVLNDKTTSAPSVTILVPGEVTIRTATSGNEQVTFAWDTPVAATLVEVWRKLERAPAARYDGQLVATTTHGEHRDIGLPNEQKFGYRIVALYSDGASRGVTFEAIPSTTPAPIALPAVVPPSPATAEQGKRAQKAPRRSPPRSGVVSESVPAVNASDLCREPVTVETHTVREFGKSVGVDAELRSQPVRTSARQRMGVSRCLITGLAALVVIVVGMWLYGRMQVPVPKNQTVAIVRSNSPNPPVEQAADVSEVTPPGLNVDPRPNGENSDVRPRADLNVQSGRLKADLGDERLPAEATPVESPSVLANRARGCVKIAEPDPSALMPGLSLIAESAVAEELARVLREPQYAEDPSCQHALALLFLALPPNKERNATTALELLQSAHAGGERQATSLLAALTALQANAARLPLDEARRLANEAADQGDIHGMFVYAKLLWLENTDQARSTATEWMIKAARLHYSPATAFCQNHSISIP